MNQREVYKPVNENLFKEQQYHGIIQFTYNHTDFNVMLVNEAKKNLIANPSDDTTKSSGFQIVNIVIKNNFYDPSVLLLNSFYDAPMA